METTTPQQPQPPLFRALNPLSPTAVRLLNPPPPSPLMRQLVPAQSPTALLPFNPLSPTTRQTTRALQEIQFQRALTTPTTQLRPADITGTLSSRYLFLVPGSWRNHLYPHQQCCGSGSGFWCHFDHRIWGG
jgi:hypothetical protein